MTETSAAPTQGADRWWEDGQVMKRFVCDLIVADLRTLRPSSSRLPALPWEPTLHISRELDVDSLELLSLASSLAEAIHLHESGIEDYLLARPTIQDWAVIAQTGLQEFSATLTFRTSGSTGLAKPCTHPLDHLQQEIRELTPLFAGRRRIFSAVPSHHIYGFLFTILLPRALSLSNDHVVDVRGSSPAGLARVLSEGDLVVAHPDFWRAVTRSMPAIPPGVIGVTSTAPCADEVSAALEAGGLSQLFQIYGSSETAGVGWRASASSPYKLFSFWKKANVEGSELIRTAPDAKRVVHYCQDRLEWISPVEFRVIGRVDDVVQVGGSNVSPQKVRTILMQYPDVVDAAVRLMHASEGSRLKAFIVVRNQSSNPTMLHGQLEEWVNTRLSAPERPKSFTFGHQLPQGASGKDADWLITADARFRDG